MENSQRDGRYTPASITTIHSSINHIVQCLEQLTTRDKHASETEKVASTTEIDSRTKMLHTLRKAIDFAPLLQAPKSNVIDQPANLDDYLKNWMAAGSPKFSVAPIHLEDKPTDIFCIWLAYKDIKPPTSLPPLDTTPTQISYKVDDIPGYGKGCIATRSIAAGELIMIDRAALITPTAVAYLDRSELEELLDANIQVLRRRERELLENLCDILPKSLGGKWRRIRLNNAVSVEFPESKLLPHYCAVFPILARCNHSCGPNASAHFKQSTLTIELRAERNIAEGEQVTFGYIDLLENQTARHKELLSKYEFTCECSYCVRPERDASDMRRNKIRIATDEFCEKLWWSAGIDRVIKIHLDLLDAIELEGLQRYKHRHLRWLVRAYAALGDTKNTRRCAAEAAKSPCVLMHSENAITERHLWQLVATDVERHPDWRSLCTDSSTGSNFLLRESTSGESSTDLQASTIKAAEVAYRKAGQPDMGPIFPFKDYQFCVWIIFGDISSKYPADHTWGSPAPATNPPSFHVGPAPLTGNGLIADRKFTMAELIVSERPIVIYPADFFNIHLPANVYRQDYFISMLERALPSLDRRVYTELMDLPDPGAKVSKSKIYRIVTSNSQLVKIALSEHLPRYCGIFPTLARCNHSCSPNAAIAFDSSTLVMELRAIRSIKPGEEITYAYDNILEAYEARQKRYKELYGFVCRCRHCEAHANDPVGDNRRVKISALVTNEIASLPISPKEKMQRYEEILKAISEENLGLYRYRCLVKLCETSAYSHDFQSALKWSQESMKTKYVAPIDGVESFEKKDVLSSALKLFSGHPLFNSST